ncbi:BA3454 family stress response protein [Ectobacillus panaciterrae]|nr:BA3454 family stress response protein [Ectobacillus panaciterrae]
MMEITVTVNYQGKSYQTNVIVDRGATKEEILYLAQEQVRKQWTLRK